MRTQKGSLLLQHGSWHVRFYQLASYLRDRTAGMDGIAKQAQTDQRKCDGQGNRLALCEPGH